MKFFLFKFLINLKIIFSYIELPFMTYKKDFIYYFINNYIYINLDVGIPKQNNTKLLLNQGKFSFYLYDNNIYPNASYNFKLSKRYRTLLDDEFELSSSNCAKGKFSMETFFIQNQRVDNFTFILCTKTFAEEKEFFDGQLGLNLGYQIPPDSNFIQVLKIKELINNYIYTIYYVNDYEGFLLIGEYPHKINSDFSLYEKYSEFKESNLLWIHSEMSKKNYHWTILFDKISYGAGELYQAQREAKISIEFQFIISTQQYYNLFKEIFGKKCEHIHYHNDYSGFRCSKDINKDLTPEIKFYNKELNTTFVLDYNDLYIEKDNFLYFLVATFFDYDLGYWILGKPFLKKYLLMYNSDNKMIGFYKKNEGNKSNKKISSYVISIFLNILLLIILIVLSFAFFHYYIKRRRIRANELEDKFNYIPKNNKNDYTKYNENI